MIRFRELEQQYKLKTFSKKGLAIAAHKAREAHEQKREQQLKVRIEEWREQLD
jgi:CCR4-NOT transcriptional regulation complex NOT5 subunit